MPSRLGHGLYKKIDRLKNIFRCIYIIIGFATVITGIYAAINNLLCFAWINKSLVVRYHLLTGRG